MSKPKVTTELSVKLPTHSLIAAVDAKIAAIKTISESPFKTGMNHPIMGNLKTCTSIETLLKALANVIGMEAVYNKAGKRCSEVLNNGQFPTFHLEGGTAKHWEEDIKLRIQIVQQEDTLKKLSDYRTRLSNFMSEAEKKEMLLKEIEEFMGKI